MCTPQGGPLRIWLVAACMRAAPPKLLSWDAYSLVGTYKPGADVSVWGGNGTLPLDMWANGDGNFRLRMESADGCVPHVSFYRYGKDARSWFESKPLTIPNTFSGPAGVTIVAVVSMSTIVDDLVVGSAWERVFQCNDTSGLNNLGLARRESSNDMAVMLGDGGVNYTMNTQTAVITGSFQVLVFRIAHDASGAVFTDGALTELIPGSDKARPISFPGRYDRCYLGTAADDSLSLSGGIREVSVFLGAMSDLQMEQEYNRALAQWAPAACPPSE